MQSRRRQAYKKKQPSRDKTKKTRRVTTIIEKNPDPFEEEEAPEEQDEELTSEEEETKEDIEGSPIDEYDDDDQTDPHDEPFPYYEPTETEEETPILKLKNHFLLAVKCGESGKLTCTYLPAWGQTRWKPTYVFLDGLAKCLQEEFSDFLRERTWVSFQACGNYHAGKFSLIEQKYIATIIADKYAQSDNMSSISKNNESYISKHKEVILIAWPDDYCIRFNDLLKNQENSYEKLKPKIMARVLLHGIDKTKVEVKKINGSHIEIILGNEYDAGTFEANVQGLNRKIALDPYWSDILDEIRKILEDT